MSVPLWPAIAAPANQLSEKEKAADWKLLFDGKTTQGWRGFRRDKFPTEGWAIEDGTIKHLAGGGEHVPEAAVQVQCLALWLGPGPCR